MTCLKPLEAEKTTGQAEGIYSGMWKRQRRRETNGGIESAEQEIRLKRREEGRAAEWRQKNKPKSPSARWRGRRRRSHQHYEKHQDPKEDGRYC